MKTVTHFVVGLTALGLFMALVLHAEAVKRVLAGFVGIVRDVFALGGA